MTYRQAQKLKIFSFVKNKANGQKFKVVHTVEWPRLLKKPTVFIECTGEDCCWCEFMHTEVIALKSK